MKHLIISTAIVAAAALPGALAAQSDARGSAIPRYHLTQISVDSTKVSAEDFKAQTEAIRNCKEASELAKSLDGDFRRNRFLKATSLPDHLRDEVKDLPLGHATEVFTDDGSTLRVLVLCYRL